MATTETIKIRDAWEQRDGLAIYRDIDVLLTVSVPDLPEAQPEQVAVTVADAPAMPTPVPAMATAADVTQPA